MANRPFKVSKLQPSNSFVVSVTSHSVVPDLARFLYILTVLSLQGAERWEAESNEDSAN